MAARSVPQGSPPGSPRAPLARCGSVALITALAMHLVACGGDDRRPVEPPAEQAGGLPRPVSVGPGPRYRPLPTGRAVARAADVGRLRCSPRAGHRFGAHLEIFANRRVVVIPAGIGVAPPLVRKGAYVRAGRCHYSARTLEPTGLIEIREGSRLRLGDLFRLWSQPLSARRVAGFRAGRGKHVLAFVGGRPWRGDPRAIPLNRHAVIVLEVGGYVPPHESYRYPPGL